MVYSKENYNFQVPEGGPTFFPGEGVGGGGGGGGGGCPIGYFLKKHI